MKFELLEDVLINYEQLESLSCHDNPGGDDGSQSESPYELHFDMASGKTIKQRFAEEYARNKKFNGICDALSGR